MINEKANENYNTDFINRQLSPNQTFQKVIRIQKNIRMYCEEGREKFTVRQNVLGHMQQVWFIGTS